MGKIADNFRVDLLHKSDFSLTKTGDLFKIRGKENLRQALFHRLITVPGTLVHRPLYGVGVKTFQNRIDSITNRRDLFNRIVSQFEDDDRVESVDAVTTIQDALNAGLFLIKTLYTTVDFGGVETTFNPFEITL